MSLAAPDVEHGVLLAVTWGCLSHKSYHNPCYKVAFPTNDLVVETFKAADIVWCDGLSDVLRSSSAPPLAWLVSVRISALHDRKILPAKSWGIYLHILEKPGCRTLIYIGSATESTIGLRNRFKDYAIKHAVAQEVLDALNDDYKITRSVILGHCPIPEPTQQPITRALLLALEAAFNAIFWSMSSRRASYGHLAANRIWPMSSQWDGLNGHSPLLEGVRGLDHTPEELADIAKARKDRQNEILRNWAKAKLKADRANPTPEFREQRTKINKRRYKRRKAQREDALANGTHRCHLCERNYPSAKELRTHKTRPLHTDREARQATDN